MILRSDSITIKYPIYIGSFIHHSLIGFRRNALRENESYYYANQSIMFAARKIGFQFTADEQSEGASVLLALNQSSSTARSSTGPHD